MWLLQHGTGGPRGEGCGVGAQPQLPGGVRNVGACRQQRAPRYQTQHQRLANVTPSREVASLLSPLAPSLLPAPTQAPSPASGPPQPPAPKVIWGQGQPVGRGGVLGPTPTVSPLSLPTPALGIPGPASHPTWSIPRPKPLRMLRLPSPWQPPSSPGCHGSPAPALRVPRGCPGTGMLHRAWDHRGEPGPGQGLEAPWCHQGQAR